MNKFMKLTRLLLILLLIAPVGFFSCSRAEPKIVYGFIELVCYPGENGNEERYSFFILPEDDDGVENLDELYLYHDRESLRWYFTSADWIKHEEDGQIWIGSRSIAMHDSLPMPRGQYRAVLVNKGGESTERRFTYDGPEAPPYPQPVLSIGDGVYNIDSQYPVNRLIGYDQQGRTAQTVSLTANEGYIRDLRFSSTVRSVALWAESTEYHFSILTDPITLR